MRLLIPLDKAGVMICADRRFPDVVKEILQSRKGRLHLSVRQACSDREKRSQFSKKSRSRRTANTYVFVHPAEFLVTAPDGSIVPDSVLLGDRVGIACRNWHGQTDSSGVFLTSTFPSGHSQRTPTATQLKDRHRNKCRLSRERRAIMRQPSICRS